MEVRVMTGRTVEEAIELALKELEVDRDEAEVEVLSKGKSGFLGIGAELARVRVTKIAVGGSAATIAVEAVSRILQAARVNVSRTLRAAHDAEAGGPIIDLAGEDSGLLIGHRGQTLQALQFLVTLIVRQKLGGESVRVVLDVEHYRQRRETSLRDMATKVATRVVQSSRSITLEPMSPADRRIVHITLAEHSGVTTESTGEGEDRKVTIMPKRREEGEPKPA